jgi:hypothetical protein
MRNEVGTGLTVQVQCHRGPLPSGLSPQFLGVLHVPVEQPGAVGQTQAVVLAATTLTGKICSCSKFARRTCDSNFDLDIFCFSILVSSARDACLSNESDKFLGWKHYSKCFRGPLQTNLPSRLVPVRDLVGGGFFLLFTVVFLVSPFFVIFRG